MKRRPSIFLLVASVLSVCSVALAQPKKQPLTNIDSVKMIKAESSDTPRVLINQLVGLPSKEGYFYKSGSEWIELGHSYITKAKIKGFEKTVLTGGIVSSGIDVVYEGPHAQLKLTDRRPTFYVQMPGQSSFIDQYFFRSSTKQVIVQLKQKKSSRRLEITPVGVFSFMQGSKFRKKDVHETVVIRVSSDVVAITPKSDLTPGEYLLTVVKPGRHGAEGGHGYDFTILP